MRNVRIVAIVLMSCVVAATGVAAQHHYWKPSPAGSTGSLQPSLVQPRAVLGPSNGVYCPDLSDGAFGVHDLGWIPSGMNVQIDVESYSDNAFDPVAAVLVATLGVPGGNNIKTTTFYDNDTGGGKDVRISFVTPQASTYVLLVADNSGQLPGCYRYQAYIH